MKSAKYRFAWRQGNRFRLLIDGGRFFPVMLDAIGAVRHTIFLEFYLFESGQVADRFVHALLAARRRGVRVCLLIDDFGSRLLQRGDRQRLATAGVELLAFNPLRPRRWLGNLPRDHRKLLIVDGRVVFTGGAGLTDAFSPESSPGTFWHELMLEIRGPVVVDWLALFAETWSLTGGSAVGREVRASPPLAGGHPGRVASYGRLLHHTGLVRTLLNRVRRAQHRVWLATAYFLPTWKLRRALQRAARRGIDVRLLLPGPLTDHPSVRRIGHRYYGPLLRAGVRIFEYQPRFLHAKVQLCDDWASLGSSNLDRWNMRWNLEANQELKGQEILGELEALFRADFSASREIRYEDWLRRPCYLRWLEQLWSLVEVVARRLTEGWRPGPPP